MGGSPPDGRGRALLANVQPPASRPLPRGTGGTHRHARPAERRGDGRLQLRRHGPGILLCPPRAKAFCFFAWLILRKAEPGLTEDDAADLVPLAGMQTFLSQLVEAAGFLSAEKRGADEGPSDWELSVGRLGRLHPDPDTLARIPIPLARAIIRAENERRTGELEFLGALFGAKTGLPDRQEVGEDGPARAWN